MEAFSQSLVELYELAERAPPAAFAASALGLVREWVGFDGAVFGTGQAVVDPATHLEITQAHIDGRDERILADYGAVSADDPITQAFLGGLAAPLRADCRALYAGHALPALHAFSEAHGLRYLMLFGDTPAGEGAGRWLVVYRGDGRGFGAREGERMHALWLHLSRALGINRAAALARLAPGREQRACALVGAAGRIDAADARFEALLRTEWPGWRGPVLPQALRDAVAQGVGYEGRAIDVACDGEPDARVCTARLLEAAALLTPGERAVARRFAAGRSHKDIAREMSISPNTVRSHLLHVYAKLGVHDKAALAQRLGR